MNRYENMHNKTRGKSRKQKNHPKNTQKQKARKFQNQGHPWKVYKNSSHSHIRLHIRLHVHCRAHTVAHKRSIQTNKTSSNKRKKKKSLSIAE